MRLIDVGVVVAHDVVETAVQEVHRMRDWGAHVLCSICLDLFPCLLLLTINLAFTFNLACYVFSCPHFLKLGPLGGIPFVTEAYFGRAKAIDWMNDFPF